MRAAGLDADKVFVVADFPDRAVVKGAAIGAHIELRGMAAAELLRAAICQTIAAGSPAPRQLEPEARRSFVT